MDIMKQTRDANIDLLRVIACVAVVGLHTIQKDLSFVSSTLYYLCGFAVPIFFMISGYMLFQKERITYGYSIKKIVTIIKFTLLWSIIIGIVKVCFSFFNGNLSVVSIFKILLNYPKGFFQKGEFWHFWYFGALIIIYMLLPCLHKMYGSVLRCWLILAVICVLIQCGSYISYQPLQRYVPQPLRIWSWIRYFFLGGIILKYKSVIFEKAKNVNLILVLTSLIILFLQNILGRFVLGNLYAEYFYDDPFTILWCAVIFVWAIKYKFSDRAIQRINVLAPLTLGVYTIHPLIKKFVTKFYSIESIIISVIYFILMLIVSFGLTYIIKKTKISALVELR